MQRSLQFMNLEWFVQRPRVFVHHCFYRGGLQITAGEDDRQVRPMMSRSSRHLSSVHSRHGKIDNHRVGIEAVDLGQRGCTVFFQNTVVAQDVE